VGRFWAQLVALFYQPVGQTRDLQETLLRRTQEQHRLVVEHVLLTNDQAPSRASIDDKRDRHDEEELRKAGIDARPEHQRQRPDNR
jgi:hypothetical protein